MTPTSESSATSAPSGSPFLVRSISVPTGNVPEVHTPVAVEAGTPVGTTATEAVPIDIFEEHRGRPYIADVLDLTSDFGKTGVEKEMTLINDYVLAQIDEQQLKATADSYRAILAKIEGDMGLDPNLRGDVRAKQLAKYISIVNEETKLAKERKALLRV